MSLPLKTPTVHSNYQNERSLPKPTTTQNQQNPQLTVIAYNGGIKHWNNSKLQKYQGNPALLISAGVGILGGLINKILKPIYQKHKKGKSQENIQINALQNIWGTIRVFVTSHKKHILK